MDYFMRRVIMYSIVIVTIVLVIRRWILPVATCTTPQPVLIYSLRRDMRRICEFFEHHSVPDPDVDRLLERFEETRICVGNSSHTWDKRNIRICLKNPEQDAKDYPLLLFVCIHELAHVMTPDWGHGKNFWENMGLLLAVADRLDILNTDSLRLRLQNGPVELHCGTVISSDYVPPKWLYTDVL